MAGEEGQSLQGVQGGAMAAQIPAQAQSSGGMLEVLGALKDTEGGLAKVLSVPPSLLRPVLYLRKGLRNFAP